MALGDYPFHAELTDPRFYDQEHGFCANTSCPDYDGAKLPAGDCPTCLKPLNPWPTAWDVDWDELFESRS